jgi:small GTP-binding protein
MKIMVVGDHLVGKMCVIRYYVHNKKADQVLPTVCIDFLKHNATVDSRSYNVQIWDTAGTERYRLMVTSWLRRGDVFLLMFALDSVESFSGLLGWLEIIRDSRRNATVPVVLVGNKTDLRLNRVVSAQAAEDFAVRQGYSYCETSAATGDDINDIFERAVREAAEGLELIEPMPPQTAPSPRPRC